MSLNWMERLVSVSDSMLEDEVWRCSDEVMEEMM